MARVSITITGLENALGILIWRPAHEAKQEPVLFLKFNAAFGGMPPEQGRVAGV